MCLDFMTHGSIKTVRQLPSGLRYLTFYLCTISLQCWSREHPCLLSCAAAAITKAVQVTIHDDIRGKPLHTHEFSFLNTLVMHARPKRWRTAKHVDCVLCCRLYVQAECRAFCDRFCFSLAGHAWDHVKWQAIIVASVTLDSNGTMAITIICLCPPNLISTISPVFNPACLVHIVHPMQGWPLRGPLQSLSLDYPGTHAHATLTCELVLECRHTLEWIDCKVCSNKWRGNQ